MSKIKNGDYTDLMLDLNDLSLIIDTADDAERSSRGRKGRRRAGKEEIIRKVGEDIDSVLESPLQASLPAGYCVPPAAVDLTRQLYRKLDSLTQKEDVDISEQQKLKEDLQEFIRMINPSHPFLHAEDSEEGSHEESDSEDEDRMSIDGKNKRDADKGLRRSARLAKFIKEASGEDEDKDELEDILGEDDAEISGDEGEDEEDGESGDTGKGQGQGTGRRRRDGEGKGEEVAGDDEEWEGIVDDADA
ncbi:Hypothetical protein D9617_36g063320 [Elsinoe fawcettii]|nr:Hypothetical protein D9617_36g063320 [Elsinoe fawcettii]